MALHIVCKNCSHLNEITDINQKVCRKCSTPFPDEIIPTIKNHVINNRPFLIQLGLYLSMAYSIFVSYLFLNSAIGCGNYNINGQAAEASDFNRLIINFLPSLMVAFLIWYSIKKNDPMTRILCVLFWPLYMFSFAMISFQDQNWFVFVLSLFITMLLPLMSTIAYFYYKPNVVKYYNTLKSINDRPHVG